MIDDAFIISGQEQTAPLEFHIIFGWNQVNLILLNDCIVMCLQYRHFSMFTEYLTKQTFIVWRQMLDDDVSQSGVIR